MENFAQNILYPALGSALAILLGILINAAIDWVKRQASTSKHGQAIGVIMSAAQAAFNGKIKPSIQAKLADGKVTDAEWAELWGEVKSCARDIALDEVKSIRGFLPKDLNKWVDTQLDVALGGLFGGTSSGEADEDPLANTPASEDSN